jgi:hypothetical protein
MNRTQANEIRATLGLAPLVGNETAERARKRRQDANRAAHAQLQRDLKSLRSKGKK